MKYIQAQSEEKTTKDGSGNVIACEVKIFVKTPKWNANTLILLDDDKHNFHNWLKSKIPTMEDISNTLEIIKDQYNRQGDIEKTWLIKFLTKSKELSDTIVKVIMDDFAEKDADVNKHVLNIKFEADLSILNEKVTNQGNALWTLVSLLKSFQNETIKYLKSAGEKPTNYSGLTQVLIETENFLKGVPDAGKTV